MSYVRTQMGGLWAKFCALPTNDLIEGKLGVGGRTATAACPAPEWFKAELDHIEGPPGGQRGMGPMGSGGFLHLGQNQKVVEKV